MMNKFQKSQVLVLVLVLLLIITLILPFSLRPTYLYLILNFIIIALGAEAGLLSLFPTSLEDIKQKLHVIPTEAIFSEKKEASSTTTSCEIETSEHVEKRVGCVTIVDKVQKCLLRPSLFFTGGEEGATTTCVSEIETSEHVRKEIKEVEKSGLPQSRVACVTIVDKVQKCLLRPSLFFIGGEESDAETMDEEEFEAEEETNGGVKGQELFAKAEAFIGNFYKQLKIQRSEESSLYQNSF